MKFIIGFVNMYLNNDMIRFKNKDNNIKHELTNEEINLKIHELVLKTITAKRTYLSDICIDMSKEDGYYKKMVSIIKEHIHD